MTTLSANEMQRLIMLLGMMGSDHDGEVMNAAKAAMRLLGKAGLTWEEVLQGIPGGKYSDDDMRSAIALARKQGYDIGLEEGKSGAPKVKEFGKETFAQYSQRLLDDYGEYVNEWEKGFLEGWKDRQRIPSDKQFAIFERLAKKTQQKCPTR
jgi:hypothetical protein